MNLLEPGDQFPTLAVSMAAGDSLVLPDALEGDFGVVPLFRGSWFGVPVQDRPAD